MDIGHFWTKALILGGQPINSPSFLANALFDMEVP
jgi:hypothetical protein